MQHLILFFWGLLGGGGRRCVTASQCPRLSRKKDGRNHWEESGPTALALRSGGASVPSSLALCRNQRYLLPRARGEMRCANNFRLD